MKLSEYAKQQGATLPLFIIARIQKKHPNYLNEIYKGGDLKRIDEMIVDSEARFKSICKGG